MNVVKKITIVFLSIFFVLCCSSCYFTSINININNNKYSTDHTFRNKKRLEEHYKKHGIEMGYSSKEEYQYEADQVIHNSDSLHKKEKEDGDDVYYLESKNELVIVSTDGYIRTFFEPYSRILYFYRQ